MKPTLKVFLFIAALALTACNKTTPINEIEGFDYGRVRNDKYTNTFFDIEFNIPKGWQIQDDKQKKELMKEGSDLVFNDEETKKAAIKSSDITSANLLTAISNNPGTTGFAHNILLLAENMEQHPSVVTGDIYLQSVSKILSSGKLEIIQMDRSFPKKVLNGKDYYEMSMAAHIQGMDVHQTYLITIDKGFAVGFIYSYVNDEQKAELEKIIQSLKPYKGNRAASHENN
ncbi:hypothetical protein R1T16_08685 [Flavobacterium sp. DG1-102-2]|uniref:hypothetical protein n=1 Tax=Flavobacterium sp. DG1-102-2 TaxID=3081663 RepID=UPI00294A8329|nr:hypothetical protein [Flavobacterium sp. DG1-102-2]MDV6168498.1 hypothetical protein [Flavobacterium sp. DG1-102-2]